MKPEYAARILAILGTILFIAAAGVRVFAASILGVDDRYAPGSDFASERQPVMGAYTLANNDTEVTFSRGVTIAGADGKPSWIGNTYTLNLQTGDMHIGGSLNSSSPAYFEARPDGGLTIRDENIKVGIGNYPVVRYAISQYGHDLAFITPDSLGAWQLFAVRQAFLPSLGANIFRFIAKEDAIADIHWDIHGGKLTYVAPRAGVDQVFLYDFAADTLTQLTNDAGQKSAPDISPDGTHVAYLSTLHTERRNSVARHTPTPLILPHATPDPASLEYANHAPVAPVLYVVDVISKQSRMLTPSGALGVFAPGWTADGQVTFSQWQVDWQQVAWLMAVPLSGGQITRLNPPVAVDSLRCTPDFWGANSTAVDVTISNQGKAAITVPVEVAADTKPLDVVLARSAKRVQREDIPLKPGESRTLHWNVPVPDDPRVYLSASIESGVEFPAAAQFCHIAPRWVGMPRLRWVGLSLGLLAVGFVICLPWLRHQKRRWLWAVWVGFAVLIFLFMLAESSVILGWWGT